MTVSTLESLIQVVVALIWSLLLSLDDLKPGSMVREALIHWVKEGRWDVWATTKLPQEHRQEGALGMFPWTDGKNYLGKVVKISCKY